jgi:nitrate reductase gamma subunit
MIGFLFVAGLLFALAGFYSLIDPNTALGVLGLHMEAVNSFSQERGTAGGVTLAIGIFLIAGAHYPGLRRPALWMVTVVLAGLEAGRLLSLVLDGVPGMIVWFYAGLEVLGLVQGIYWLRREIIQDPR